MPATPAPTGRRESEARDTLDKGRLLNAGRLMDRRDKREIEALKQTIEDLKRQLEGSRNKSEVAVAMSLEGSGPAIKALQRERDAMASKRSTSTNGDSCASDDQKRQLATLKTQLDDALKATSALQRKVDALETKGSSDCDKTKLAAQLKLAKQSQSLAEEDKTREVDYANNRLATANKRIETLESELRTARAIANGVKAERKEASVLERERNEAWDQLQEERRGHEQEQRERNGYVERLEKRNRELGALGQQRLAEINGLEDKLAMANAVSQALQTRLMQTASGNNNGPPASRELAQANKKIEHQKGELAQLNSRAVALKAATATQSQFAQQLLDEQERITRALCKRDCEYEKQKEQLEVEMAARMEIEAERDALRARVKAADEERFDLDAQRETQSPNGSPEEDEALSGRSDKVKSRLVEIRKLANELVCVKAQAALATDEAQKKIDELTERLAEHDPPSAPPAEEWPVPSGSSKTMNEVCSLVERLTRKADILHHSSADLYLEFSTFLMQMQGSK
ncbi:hypothetical protein Rhopal_005298-T1 [Rhodotorula paludigena]|uniref:Uncharacterized protein n=1 Tax=Rhodotorula paludigena TaxID=86838 RepID=A0AAV5GQ20_9BASI|nr:hypothetical protein Rhopal_005298-T1 [Rhodotorula paludigena]